MNFDTVHSAGTLRTQPSNRQPRQLDPRESRLLVDDETAAIPVRGIEQQRAERPRVAGNIAEGAERTTRPGVSFAASWTGGPAVSGVGERTASGTSWAICGQL